MYRLTHTCHSNVTSTTNMSKRRIRLENVTFIMVLVIALFSKDTLSRKHHLDLKVRVRIIGGKLHEFNIFFPNLG